MITRVDEQEAAVSVDLSFVLHLYGDSKPLMGDFFARPPPLREHCEKIFITITLDILVHGHRRPLQRTCSS